jgi:adenylylsulfate kinase
MALFTIHYYLSTFHFQLSTKMILQFTGLSGAGKTTLAQAIQPLLQQQQIEVVIIDGDVYRNTLCKDLGFSKADRCENIRRLGKVAHEAATADNVVIIAAINPYQAIRKELEAQYNAQTVWIQCHIDVLAQRDTKGLYKRAALPDGHPEKINNLTGVNDVYEPPTNPQLVINTASEQPDISAEKLFRFIMAQRG